MRLSEKQKKILGRALLTAGESLNEIAQQTNYREHSIRYVLKQLGDAEIIKPSAYINVYPLGYSYHGLWFNFGTNSAQEKDRLLDYLLESERVAYVRENGGAFTHTVGICARNLEELTEFLDELGRMFGSFIKEKFISRMCSMTDFSLKFFTPDSQNIQQLHMGIGREKVKIDELDHRILSCLSSCGSPSSTAIARELGVPASTIAYRLNHLKEQDIWMGTRFLVDFAKIGLQTYIHLVYVRGIVPDLQDRLLQFARNHPYIYYIVKSLGDFEFELGSAMEHSQEAASITQQLQESFGAVVERVVTFPCFSTPKISYYPFKQNSWVIV